MTEAMKQTIANVARARDLCGADSLKNQTLVGTIKCPVCGHSLDYKISEYNGHCHGQCRTEDCLTWME